MLVCMNITISGSRDGEAWPPIGGTLDIPDHEAAELIANGYAEEATDAQTATVDDTTAAVDGDADTAPQSDTQPSTQGDATVPTARRKR